MSLGHNQKFWGMVCLLYSIYDDDLVNNEGDPGDAVEDEDEDDRR